MKNIIAVIHARGGSVRVPKKNIRDLGGKPLIEWTISAALKSNCTRVIVSTDCEDIASIARNAGADVPFKRPLEISEDVASELVTQHAIEFHEKQKNESIDLAVTIQPTTPFLSKENINEGIKTIEDNTVLDSAFTAGPVQQRPEWMFKIDRKSNIASSIFSKHIKGDLGVPQTLVPLWHPNGGAYFTKRNTLFKMGSLIGFKPGIVKMSFMNSVDIDEEIDFITAEAIAMHMNKN